jgi:hypothetical protein
MFVGMDIHTHTRRVSAIRWIPVIRPLTTILAFNTKQLFYHISKLLSFQQHQMIISTPNNMSWIKNKKIRIYDNILNPNSPRVIYPLGNVMNTRYPYTRKNYPQISYYIHNRTRRYQITPYSYPDMNNYS